MRELLADGEAHPHLELYELSCVVHSRVADLRKVLRREERERGEDESLVASWNPVLHWSDRDPRSGEVVHWYRLVPLWEHARERRASTVGNAAVVEEPALSGAVLSPGGPGASEGALGPPVSESRHTAKGESGERIPAGSPANGRAGSDATVSGPAAAAAEVTFDLRDREVAEREYEQSSLFAASGAYAR